MGLSSDYLSILHDLRSEIHDSERSRSEDLLDFTLLFDSFMDFDAIGGETYFGIMNEFLGLLRSRPLTVRIRFAKYCDRLLSDLTNKEKFEEAALTKKFKDFYFAKALDYHILT